MTEQRRSRSIASPLGLAWPTFKGAVLAFIAHDVFTLAAALAFYTLLSFAPLIVLAIWGASVAGAGAQDALLAQIGRLAGHEARDAADAVMRSGHEHAAIGSVAGALGIGTLVVGATTVFAQLQSSLNILFDVAARPTNAIWAWLRRRLLSAGVVLAMGFVLIVSLVVNAALGWLMPTLGTSLNVLNEVVTTAIFALLFGLLFRYLPDVRIPPTAALGGGAATAILFSVGKWAIGFYLASGDVGGAYGAAGSLAILLVWVYYSGLIFFFGATLTRSWLIVTDRAPAAVAGARETHANPRD